MKDFKKTFLSPIFALIFERVKLLFEVQSSVCNSEKYIQGRDSVLFSHNHQELGQINCMCNQYPICKLIYILDLFLQ